MYKLITPFLFVMYSISGLTQESDAELAYQETSVLIKNGKLYKTTLYEVRINNRSGEKYTKVRIPYSKYNDIRKVEAVIKDWSGTVVKKLRKGDIIEKSAISDFSLYEDHYVKEFMLKHNVYPYILSYQYQEQFNEYFQITNWRPILNRKIPTKKAKLIVEAPENYKISAKSRKIDNYKTESIGNNKKHIWEASYTKILEPEIYSPSIYDSIPNVFIVPKQFIYDVPGSFASWKSYGNWQCDLLQGLNDLPDSEKNALESLVSGVTDDKERIRLLFHYLQDRTRYVNVTIGVGGLKPYPASYVAKNKYGDCKALSNYFKAILESFNIESYMVDVYAGDYVEKIITDFPAQQFNHVILCVPFKTDTLWIDCTSDFAFNYLGTFTQNRDVLLIQKDGTHLVKTPALKINDVLESRTIKIVPVGSKSANADFLITYRGDNYESLHQVVINYNESEKSRIIRNYFVEKGFDLLDYKVFEENRDSAKISLSYSTKSTQIYKHYGNDILIKTIPLDMPGFEVPAKRKLPVKIDYPIYKIDTAQYTLSNGCSISKKLESQFVDSEFGNYRLDFQQNGRSVLVIKSFILKSGNYPLVKYGEFYKFINKVRDIENKLYIITTK